MIGAAVRETERQKSGFIMRRRPYIASIIAITLAVSFTLSACTAVAESTPDPGPAELSPSVTVKAASRETDRPFSSVTATESR